MLRDVEASVLMKAREVEALRVQTLVAALLALNDERGVLLEVEGERASVERFLARLPLEPPPLAAVESVASEWLPPAGEPGFRIVERARAGAPDALVAPDTATCDDCLRALSDPRDRRFRYPFVNCTNCGPRFTIVRGVPYDRPLTTMAGFATCPACRYEYEDPACRRIRRRGARAIPSAQSRSARSRRRPAPASPEHER